MSSAWRWLDVLDDADPQPGDLLRISRAEDIGSSRNYRLEIVERAGAAAVEPDVPADADGLPESAPTVAGDDTPF